MRSDLVAAIGSDPLQKNGSLAWNTPKKESKENRAGL
jgi:hypothetical protein